MTRKLIAAFVAIAAFAVTAPAFAEQTISYQDGGFQKSVHLSMEGRNLDTPQGAERFYVMLKRAAVRVCDADAPRSMSTRRLERACVAETLRRTVAQIDKPYLTAALTDDTGEHIVLASR